jgi:pimeloyl-ACP methyl ester carboxylesterase
MVGLSLLATHPDRLLSLSTFGTPWRLGMPSRGMRGFVSISFTLWRPFVIAIAAALCSRRWAVQKRIWKMAWRADARVLGAVTSAITPYDFIASVAASPLRVLLMHCHRDGLVGWSMGSTLRAARAMPTLTFVDLDRGGHCANLDVPLEFRAALLDFLAR